MNMKTRTLANRIVIVATVLLLLVTTLVGCGGGQAQKTLTVGTIAADTSNALKADELNAIAKMLSSVYSNDFDTQEMLVAASRGYDMTASDFDDSKASPTEQGPDNPVQAAINVIAAANAKAVNASSENQLLTEYYKNMNEKDLETLVNCFQAKVDVAAGGGFFDVLLTGVGAVLRWITNTLGFGNYLVGVCIFAILVEILMLPFAIKQHKNSIKQASLRPKEMAIRNKYKGRNDQATMQKMQQELQEFYQRENFSPYSGCLPLLIQLPIIMALYSLVIDPLHYVLGQSAGVSSALSSFYSAARAAGGFGGMLSSSNGTIAMLADIRAIEVLESLKDFAFFSNSQEVYDSMSSIAGSIPNFNIGPFNFGLVPSIERFDILLLVPVLTFVTYFFTSKLNRKLSYQPATNGGVDERQVACSNTMMDVTMPAMSTFFTFMVPAMVGVYWMFRSLIGMLKQFIIARVMPLPQFTEEDYKQAEKEMKGKRVVQKSQNAGKVRSLHYIDDEDFEDTRERALARKAAIEERERQEQAEKAKKTPFGAAPMKEENKKQDAETGESTATEQSNDNEI